MVEQTEWPGKILRKVVPIGPDQCTTIGEPRTALEDKSMAADRNAALVRYIHRIAGGGELNRIEGSSRRTSSTATKRPSRLS